MARNRITVRPSGVAVHNNPMYSLPEEPRKRKPSRLKKWFHSQTIQGLAKNAGISHPERIAKEIGRKRLWVLLKKSGFEFSQIIEATGERKVVEATKAIGAFKMADILKRIELEGAKEIIENFNPSELKEYCEGSGDTDGLLRTIKVMKGKGARAIKEWGFVNATMILQRLSERISNNAPLMRDNKGNHVRNNMLTHHYCFEARKEAMLHWSEISRKVSKGMRPYLIANSIKIGKYRIITPC